MKVHPRSVVRRGCFASFSKPTGGEISRGASFHGAGQIQTRKSLSVPPFQRGGFLRARVSISVAKMKFPLEDRLLIVRNGFKVEASILPELRGDRNARGKRERRGERGRNGDRGMEWATEFHMTELEACSFTGGTVLVTPDIVFT